MIMTGQLVCSFRTSDFVDFSNPVWPLLFLLSSRHLVKTGFIFFIV